jgi:hypothetical protein
MVKQINFKRSSAHLAHPELASRKRLLLREMIARHFRLHANAARISASSDLESLIDTAFAAAPAGRKNSTPLDRYIRDVAEQVTKAAEQPGIDPKLTSLAKSFHAEAHALCCTTCACRAGRSPCNNTSQDEAILQHGMVCWEFVSALFDSLVELAHKHYQPLLPAAGPAALDVELHTRIAATEDLAAQTQFNQDHAAQRRAQVILDLPHEHLTDRHLHKLPYILFHEIFVHTAEAWLEPAKRRPTNERCRFREGFVDAAAAHLLSAALAESPHAFPEKYRSFAAELARQVSDAHSARHSNDDPELSLGTEAAIHKRNMITARRDGRAAFEHVARLFGHDRASAFAVAANLLSLDPSQRNLLVELSFEVVDAQSGDQRTLLQSLIHHVEARDLAALNAKILAELDKVDF